MAADFASGPRQFLDGVPARAREKASGILMDCPSFELSGVTLDPGMAFAAGALLLVVDGFVVLRAIVGGAPRAVVTCEAGPGSVLLPPSTEEALVALGGSRVTLIDADARSELLRIPAVAERIVQQLTAALGQKQEGTATFALTRHIELVRRKFLHLGRSYGHVVRDGIRIDFPVSHALLAEMIGSSRETVTRAVDDLQRAGFVARSGSTYRLLVSPESVFGSA
jgi:hypothetical protein